MKNVQNRLLEDPPSHRRKMAVNNSLYIFLQNIIYSIKQGERRLPPFLVKLCDVGFLNYEGVMVGKFARASPA